MHRVERKKTTRNGKVNKQRGMLEVAVNICKWGKVYQLSRGQVC